MEKTIKLESTHEAQEFFGRYDQNLKLLEKEFNVRLSVHRENLKVTGQQENVKKATTFIGFILENIRAGDKVQIEDLGYLINSFKEGGILDKKIATLDSEGKICLSIKGKDVGPKTDGQSEYVEAIKNYDIVFGIGPAGTGKTYLAMAMAVEALKKGKVRRIILVRPAIEAGESLGFLPGDMYQKLSPYLRPLYDALYDMMEAERIEKYLEVGVIEVAPLAYMRGRTLNDAFIILDEAQNCTGEQMKMFLTRLGFDSKTVITGDLTQSDLPGGKPQGLLQTIDILKDIKGIKFTYFTAQDVVRHELVQRVIEAYSRIKNDK